ncbi:hypothetical protein [Ramlibacter alkalitolerans]|uniref:Transmembrane protein n=1 Tax=Ramlibacter alkalitolerans TaxID=2039631 RepID=A0ABS1JWE7_9BURK|nr:hypothetical protein [Ramlibacter alkalitolerans]MBL0427860.1 hypothetical protein [Ramlibacter alkalitolerans]
MTKSTPATPACAPTPEALMLGKLLLWVLVPMGLALALLLIGQSVRTGEDLKSSCGTALITCYFSWQYWREGKQFLSGEREPTPFERQLTFLVAAVWGFILVATVVTELAAIYGG